MRALRGNEGRHGRGSVEQCCILTFGQKLRSPSMEFTGTPTKTAAGLAELSARERGLTQRHRTLLLLVDGQRSLPQVLDLAQKAGVSAAHLDELVALGLVSVPIAASASPRDAVAMPPPVAVAADELPAAAAATVPMGLDVNLDDDAQALTASEWAVLNADDPALAEAREILLQALLHEAPVAGAITALRVRRAASRSALLDLLPQVQEKLDRPRRLIDAAHIIRRAQELLVQ
jgi:hypothetical protein